MHVFWIIFFFVTAACVGSFLNVLIYRLPRGESIVFPGSHCPSCGRGIRWYDNIPLLSWLVLKGRCRFCKARISPRYIVVEGVTGAMVAALYVGYYVIGVRRAAGTFGQSWPIFLSHAALLCGLLACSAVDVEKWIVPLEICWVVAAVGVIASTASPHVWVRVVSPAMGAAAVAALVGLAISLLLQKRGLIQPSFIDAGEKPTHPPANRGPSPSTTRKRKRKKRKGRGSQKPARRQAPAPTAVAVTKAHGVDPRREVLREAVFLAPPILLAVIAAALVGRVEAIGSAWGRLCDPSVGGGLAAHFRGFQAALFGYLVGGLWVWAMRVLGTLGFGKEAMGLGDVHILAAVGAVNGWIVPSLAFFVAPFFALIWALYLVARRNQRELPYGPWLALASAVVMLSYDLFAKWLRPHADALRHLFD
jgi:leader peptidase (prepilin peptidase)/N-methyltransferase